MTGRLPTKLSRLQITPPGADVPEAVREHFRGLSQVLIRSQDQLIGALQTILTNPLFAAADFRWIEAVGATAGATPTFSLQYRAPGTATWTSVLTLGSTAILPVVNGGTGASTNTSSTAYVALQAASPGTQQTGNLNVSGTVLGMGGDNFFGAGANGGTGTYMDIGSLGDAASAWLDARGSGASVTLNLRSKGTSTISLLPGGTNTVTAPSTGGWGVGTAGPTSSFGTSVHVLRTADGNGSGVRVQANGGGNTGDGVFGASDNVYLDATLQNLYLRTLTAAFINLRINNVDKLRLDTSGNLSMPGKAVIGAAIGTTPVSNLRVNGLSIFANNAAAITGGLAAGDFYRTGGDPDTVCVVH